MVAKRKPSALEETEFIRIFAGVYENSLWVAERVFAKGLGTDDDSVEAMHTRMKSVVDAAPLAKKRELLNSHPELSGSVVAQATMTDYSQSEQSGAGLDQCTPTQVEQLRDLNQSYREKFGFPFIIAVSGLTLDAILQAFSARSRNAMETELINALAEVDKITFIRLQRIFSN